MKLFFAFLSFGFTAPLCVALDSQELGTAVYGYTAMCAMGKASSIEQVFWWPSSGREITVEYRNGPAGNLVHIRLSGGEILDARKDAAMIKALRSALCAYLASKDRNERAAVDVTSALCIVDEPSLSVFSVVWMGSQGKTVSSELGEINLKK
jgi:hypothetical protein